MTEKIETLANHMHKLNAEDQAIICAAVNTVSTKYHFVHRGSLPFMPLQHVAHCLSNYSSSRRHMKILSKLGWPQNTNSTVEFLMQLDNGKVLKRFGAHPERGKLMLQHHIKRERDRKMFERETDAYDLIPPAVTLTKVEGGQQNWWRVSIHPRYYKEITIWLRQYCK